VDTGDRYTLIFSIVPKEPVAVAGGVAGGAGAGGDGSAAAAPLLSISGKDTLGSAGMMRICLCFTSVYLLD
jgi:hypothetical protein